MPNFVRSLLCIAVIVYGLAVPSYGHCQQDSSPAVLRAVGPDGAELRLTADEWAKLPRAAVKAVDHGGVEVTFDGVPAGEILKLAGAPLGQQLRGQRLTLYVLAEAADGYKAVYALPEFDPEFTDGLILIADRRNGGALGPNEGPLRIVVPWEKRQARWVRQLTRLRVGQAP